MSDPDRPGKPQPDQAQVYRIYLQLQQIQSERFPASLDGLAGRLVACIGFDIEGAELALATTISGGTFLGVEPSSENLKAAVRNGSCDFMVNTLDESLRVLKNELRKRKPLAVGLLGDAPAVLSEMVERGVQPDLVAEMRSDNEASPDCVASLLELTMRGAGKLDARATHFSAPGGQIEATWSAATLADLKRMDMLAQEQLPAADTARQRWLRQAPGYFHRQRPLRRVLALRPEELLTLQRALQKAISAGKIEGPAAICWLAEDGSRREIELRRT
ncbi:MAG: hypothetical protein ACRD28_13285 [Acidobacteriaceae bacterium]